MDDGRLSHEAANFSFQRKKARGSHRAVCPPPRPFESNLYPVVCCSQSDQDHASQGIIRLHNEGVVGKIHSVTPQRQVTCLDSCVKRSSVFNETLADIFIRRTWEYSGLFWGYFGWAILWSPIEVADLVIWRPIFDDDLRHHYHADPFHLRQFQTKRSCIYF